MKSGPTSHALSDGGEIVVGTSIDVSLLDEQDRVLSGLML